MIAELEKRYLVRVYMEIMPEGLTASERLILIYLKGYEDKHNKGASQRQIMAGTGIALRTFERSWRTLNLRNLIISERLYFLTERGKEAAEQALSKVGGSG